MKFIQNIEFYYLKLNIDTRALIEKLITNRLTK